MKNGNFPQLQRTQAFPCMVVLMDFWWRMSKLVQTSLCSAKPSTKKESYLHSFQVCCILYYKMAKWLQNVNMTILKSVTCLGFSNIEEMY